MWICGWLGADWAADLRPDRCGVVVDPMQDLVWVEGKEMAVVRFWVLPGHEEDFQRQPAHALILAVIDAGMGVIWDMAPDKSQQQLARLLFRDGDGRLTMGPPTPPTPDQEVGMSVGERYWRAAQLSAQK
jgi:hypothetical protein